MATEARTSLISKEKDVTELPTPFDCHTESFVSLATEQIINSTPDAPDMLMTCYFHVVGVGLLGGYRCFHGWAQQVALISLQQRGGPFKNETNTNKHGQVCDSSTEDCG